MRFITTGAIALGALLAVTAAQASCYTIYDAKNEVIYRDTAPPVDLSRPLSETLPKVAPADSRMVFSPDSAICTARIDALGAGSRDLGNAGRVTERINLTSMVSAQ
ncbi:MAG: hypothetical protein ACN6O3_06965 [Comamonas sp.]